MLLSLIIPIYNVEQYLTACINSILKQKIKDYEIILVDDGSKDNSGDICDKYANYYKNITVIHKANGGLSEARNAGIKIAQGNYLLFIDADDYIGENSLSQIVEDLKRQNKTIDIMFLEANKVFPDGKFIPLGDGYLIDKINGKNKIDVLQHLSRLNKFPGSACTKLVRREFIINNKLFFENNLLSEDIDWTIRILINASTFAYSSVDYYYYRQNREGSITNTASLKNVKDLLYIINKWANKDLHLEYQKYINSFMAYEYMIVLYNYGGLSINEQLSVENNLLKNKWLLKCGNCKKVRIIKILTDVFGVKLVSMILNRSYKILRKV